MMGIRSPKNVPHPFTPIWRWYHVMYTNCLARRIIARWNGMDSLMECIESRNKPALPKSFAGTSLIQCPQWSQTFHPIHRGFLTRTHVWEHVPLFLRKPSRNYFSHGPVTNPENFVKAVLGVVVIQKCRLVMVQRSAFCTTTCQLHPLNKRAPKQ